MAKSIGKSFGVHWMRPLKHIPNRSGTKIPVENEKGVPQDALEMLQEPGRRGSIPNSEF
jgi:hypothetical protein